MAKRAEKERRRQERAAAERARAEAERRAQRRRWLLTGGGTLAAIAAVVALAVSGGASSATGPGKSVDTSGLPRQLAANVRDANKVVDGSIDARLEGLRGFPVVVNQWAAWCPNCREEFPYFQQLAGCRETSFAFVDFRVAGVSLVAAGGVSRPGSPGLSGRAVLVTPWTIAALATVGPGNRDPEVCDAHVAIEVGRGDAARGRGCDGAAVVSASAVPGSANCAGKGRGRSGARLTRGAPVARGRSPGRRSVVPL